jgi:hypothetical protein
MENVDIKMLYNEIKAVRKKIEYLEEILIPEEELSKEELKELDKLRAEALEEHKKREAINVEDL